MRFSILSSVAILSAIGACQTLPVVPIDPEETPDSGSGDGSFPVADTGTTDDAKGGPSDANPAVDANNPVDASMADASDAAPLDAGEDAKDAGPPPVCTPGSQIACYEGPAGTQDVGTCVGGLQTCNLAGSGYGACIGQVLPAARETCGNLLDETCNGVADEGCGITYAKDVQPIFLARCSPCHETFGSGGANLAVSFADSQLPSYYCAGKTKGECALTRIQNGTMPAGRGCTGNPAADLGNTQCVTATEQATIQQWIADGQQP